MPKCPTWVVKLGGSLVAGGAALPAWLRVLSEVSTRHRVVIVAGGGPFADAVRDAQPALGIGDATAHAMAVQGMRQFALAIAALVPGATPALTTIDAFGRHEGTGLTVWEPMDPALVGSGLPEDWCATSDSIAAWLGRRIAATGTVLVKSRRPSCPGTQASALAADGFIDTWLPELLREGPQPLWWLERSATGDFVRLVDGAGLPGCMITDAA